MDKVSLTTARSNLVEGLSNNAAKLNKAAEDVVKSYASAANEISRSTENVRPTQANQPQLQEVEAEPVVAERQDLASETFLATADTPDPIESTVNLIAAKTAYTANAKALDVVNDVENAVLDILR